MSSMKRRDFLKVLSGLGIGSLTLGCDNLMKSVGGSGRASARADKPNIIYILADDLGYRELGCYGQKLIRTPNIDQLAREGIRFTDHYCGNAVCAPSRCCLMTGFDPGHAFVRGNLDYTKPGCARGQMPIPRGTITLGTMAKKAGYTTAAMGKWGLGGEDTTGIPNKQGFDYFFGFLDQWAAHFYYPTYLWRNQTKVFYPENHMKYGKTYSHDVIAAEALKFIREHRNEPFFLYLPFTIPHVSLQVPDDEILQSYLKLGWDTKPYIGGKSKWSYTGNKTPRATYAAMITRMDMHIGKIMALLKKLGLDDNTLVIFTSDNGTTYCCGVDYKFFDSVGPFKGLKGSLHEGGIREPFVARWPGKIKPGTVSHLPSAFWDMMPTFCDIMGVKTPRTDGISILPTLLGRPDKQKKHEYLYWEFPGYGYQQTVRMGKWKGYRKNVRKDPHPHLELYDLEKDISETTDVSAQYPEIVKKIEAIMAKEHTPSTAFPLLPGEKRTWKYSDNL